MARSNLATSLKRRSHGDPMRSYDALPADLRQWLADAMLPWSPASVRRAWLRAIREARGDLGAARAALSALERRRLERDVSRIWGPAHPFLACADHPVRPSPSTTGTIRPWPVVGPAPDPGVRCPAPSQTASQARLSAQPDP
jgi:hypothetical protein